MQTQFSLSMQGTEARCSSLSCTTGGGVSGGHCAGLAGTVVHQHCTLEPPYEPRPTDEQSTRPSRSAALLMPASESCSVCNRLGQALAQAHYSAAVLAYGCGCGTTPAPPSAMCRNTNSASRPPTRSVAGNGREPARCPCHPGRLILMLAQGAKGRQRSAAGATTVQLVSPPGAAGLLGAGVTCSGAPFAQAGTPAGGGAIPVRVTPSSVQSAHTQAQAARWHACGWHERGPAAGGAVPCQVPAPAVQQRAGAPVREALHTPAAVALPFPVARQPGREASAADWPQGASPPQHHRQ